MQITRLHFGELTRRQLDAWSEMQRADATIQSPFFRPEYVELVSQVAPNVEVAVLEDAGRCIGFWPYQRESGNFARPVGLSLCDFQAVIAEPNIKYEMQSLLRGCDLKAWSFDHLVDSQRRLTAFQWTQSDSPVVDLSHGFEHYRQQKRREGSESLEQALRKSRKLEREAGPLRLVPVCDDEHVFQTVIDWKRDQYSRMGSVDHLAPEWTRDLLRRISRARSDDFAGALSALYAGDHLVAAHFGMRSRDVLHCWFPTYNRDFQKYSPGMVFWLLIAQQAGELGISRIDLGKGDERYKQSLKTGDTRLAEGAVDLRWGRAAIGRGFWRARRMLRNSPVAAPLRQLVRSVRGARNGRALNRLNEHCETQTTPTQKEAVALTCD